MGSKKIKMLLANWFLLLPLILIITNGVLLIDKYNNLISLIIAGITSAGSMWIYLDLVTNKNKMRMVIGDLYGK